MKKIIILILLILVSCTTIRIRGDRRIIETKDNWKIGIERFSPLVVTSKKKYPVIICHGLMGTGEYFKQNEEDSIVYQLTKEGYEVFVLNLRGRKMKGLNQNGEEDSSTSPGYYFGKTYNDFSFDDYAKYDVDAAITYVLEVTKAEKVNWIGHSMGGMVIYARAGSMNETRIANLVTIGSPFSFPFKPKKLNLLDTVSPILSIFPTVPVGSLSAFSSWTPFQYYYLMSLYYYPENMDSKQIRKLTRLGANNESPRVFQQFANGMGNWNFESEDRKIKYTQNISNIQTPVLLIAGRRDHLGAPYIVRYVYENIGSKDKTMMMISRTDGNSEDYGHVDLVTGKGIVKDVVPNIVTWMNERNK